ncbi:MAG: hypothetical protein WBQ79_08100 [Acidobacteriaceae bacterium]|jgi:hypothetical protein
MTDALLRSLGGSVALLRMPVAASSAIGEQLGAPTAGFADLPLSPAAFRKVRVTVTDGNQAKYELLISASAVEAQVSQLGLTSAEVLFAMGLGITVGKEFFLIEGVSFTSAAGLACVYRVLLREAATQSY